jgi:DNA mismatch repair protein MutS
MTTKDKTTPVMRQFLEIKAQHKNAILFFRMGDFYEMFYEDAVVASRDMEIALTSRDRNSDNPVPMCGVPFHAAEGYIARLIRKGHRVAICDQVEDPRAAKGLVRRAVTRVVTPGTVTDAGLLEARENNFICAVVRQNSGAVGAAFLDVSTGRFLLVQSEDEDPLEFLRRELARYRPRELVHQQADEPPSETDRQLQKILVEAVPENGEIKPLFSPRPGWSFGEETARRTLTEQLGVSTLEGYGCADRTLAIRSAGGLIHYLRETQGSALGHIDSLTWCAADRFMTLDPATVKNLELVNSVEGGREGSLISVLDLTRTGMGGRKLRDWFLRPLLDAEEIRRRQEGLEELQAQVTAASRLGDRLKQILDLERLLGRVVLGTAGPRDMVALKSSIAVLPGLHRELGNYSSSILTGLHQGLDLLDDVHGLLERAISPEPPATIRDPGLIRDGYSPELDQLRSVARDGKQTIAGIEARERERTGISTLKVKYNRVFGYFIEVSKANLAAVPESYERKQTMVGAERFSTPELKEYEEQVVGAEERISELEQQLFSEVRQLTAAQAGRIKAAADRIATLDVLLGLAEAASRHRYCRPAITEGRRLRITAGRHPVIEQLSPTGERFVPNDVLLDDEQNQILIITGPNMGGKSTFLRQVALITLMAHTGSFVPAEAAEIPLVDRIFTRVGASDSLIRGHSTFMVEMIETANILNNATPRSLVILDEVGRGTSTFDGVSIAWAVVEHLHNARQVAAKSLFATHFYELTELALTLPRVRNFNISVKEWNDEIIFLREVVEGAADRSYGVQVARLAGLPPSVLRRAREILANLEANAFDRRGMPKLAGENTPDAPDSGQMPLFTPGEDPLLAEVRRLELEQMTPMGALNYLADLQRRLK